MRSTNKLDRWSPPLTRQRSLADVGPATGSVWIGRQCMSRLLSLVKFEKMFRGSVVKLFD